MSCSAADVCKCPVLPGNLRLRPPGNAEVVSDNNPAIICRLTTQHCLQDNAGHTRPLPAGRHGAPHRACAAHDPWRRQLQGHHHYRRWQPNLLMLALPDNQQQHGIAPQHAILKLSIGCHWNSQAGSIMASLQNMPLQLHVCCCWTRKLGSSMMWLHNMQLQECICCR